MCYLIPILTGLICAGLGYLLGKLLGGGQNFKVEYDAELEKSRKLSSDLNACNSRYAQSEKDILNFKSSASSASDWEAKYNTSFADLNSWKGKYTTLENDSNAWKLKAEDLESQLKSNKEAVVAVDHSTELNALKTENTSLQARIAEFESKVETYVFDAEGAKSAFEKTVKQDDLKIVEGIGPKIEELFQNAGITTWKQLSETSVEKRQEVLDSGGDNYKVHDPSTWAEQAELAYLNKWSALKKWQDELDGGKA